MANKTFTKDDALKAWEGDDKVGAFDIVETTTKDGQPDQTQILDKATGSLVIAVDGTGSEAYQRLAENPRAPKLDNGVSPKSAVEDGETRTTSTGTLATPTHPQDLEAQEGLGLIDPADLNPGVSAKESSKAAADAVDKAKK